MRSTINVLVTGIGGPIAQGLIQGLKKRQDVSVIGVDRRLVTAGHQFCDRTYQMPCYTDVDAYLNKLKEIIEKDSIEIIFPSLHEEVPIFHAHRDALKPLIALPTSNDFDVLMHKEHVYQKLESMGHSKHIPKYRGFNTAGELEEINTSLFKEASHFVVKTVDSYASLGFAILTDEANYLQALKNGRKHTVEFGDYCKIIDPSERKLAMEHLNGKEYSVDVYLHKGKAIVAVPRERTGVSNNIVLDGKVVNHDGLIRASKEITESLVEDGFINIQFMESAAGYKLTDINPRFCGSQGMSLGANVNFPSLFIEYLYYGNEVPVEPIWNTRMLRFRDQIFVYEE